MFKLNKVIHWKVEEGLLSSPAVTNRNLFAQKICNKSANEILKKYAYHDENEINDFYTKVFRLIEGIDIKGVGLELGAGVCGFTAAICKYLPDVHKIYAVELVSDVVELLQPITLPSICGTESKKVERVIGSFNNLEVDDGVIDFCFEIESLHHSEQLMKTLQETHRVLKPGGHLIMLDRAHNNKVTDEQIKYMLDVEYSEEWKCEHGYDSAMLTRRDNGEHEIRFYEWDEVFKESDLEIIKRIELRSISLFKLIKGAVLSIPFNIRRRLGLFPSRAMWHDGEWKWMLKKILRIDTQNKVFTESVRDYTLFVVRKNF